MTANQGEARAGDPFDGLPLLIPVPRAAELLGVSLRTVRNKVRSYGLPDWSSYAHE